MSIENNNNNNKALNNLLLMITNKIELYLLIKDINNYINNYINTKLLIYT